MPGPRGLPGPPGPPGPPGTPGPPGPTNPNADLLDGTDSTALLLHCPAGMTLAFRSLCFETTQAAALDWHSAFLRCFGLGLRLPSNGELGMVFRWLLSPTQSEVDWADEAPAALQHFAVRITVTPPTAAVAHEVHADTDTITHRCVTTPQNNLGASPTSAATQQASTRTRSQLKFVARSATKARRGR